MIYCIWYPSGGFGHFINAVLTVHGHNFVRPSVTEFTFSQTGDSHALPLAVPKYTNDADNYTFEFDQDLNYSVLIDNGINNEEKKFFSVFPDRKIIKMCYSDFSWPVIARTMIEKAMASTMENELPLTEWNHQQSWAIREKYFLYLRDHDLRHRWKPEENFVCVMLEDLLNYNTLQEKIESGDIVLESFDNLWSGWYSNNLKYFQPIITAQQIIQQIQKSESRSLTSIDDIWTQAVIYYYIWLTFELEIPHNDYKDFFNSTDEIIRYINQNKIVS
jgi:hypothetical protein